MKILWNKFILWKVKKKYGKNGISEAEEYLRGFKQKTNEEVYFSNYIGINDSLNASATFPGVIFIYASWTKTLVLNRDEKTYNAFLMTLGHEEGHHVVERSFPRTNIKKDKRFVKWLNEIYCDFYGLNKLLENNKEKFYESVEYKLAKKKAADKDTSDHPSWKKRKMYIEKYDWSEGLIEQIAKDTGCKNIELINKSKMYYLSEEVIPTNCNKC